MEMPEVIESLATQFWLVLSAMAPYLLFGFVVAGFLSAFLSPAFVERHLSGRGLRPVLKAAALGVPLPLCSCGVIPVAASLRKHGASRGATTAFLISTPQTGVDSLFVTYSLLGGVFTVFRPLVALISGLLGGLLVTSLEGSESQQEAGKGEPNGDESAVRGGRFVGALRHGFVTLPRDIGRSLLVGIVLAGLITVLLPPALFADVFGRGLAAMGVMLVLGIPVYVCATASVPVAAAMMFQLGVSPGAALVFLMTGPATNAATIATIWKTMGRRTAGVYLAAVMVTALASGLLLDATFDLLGGPPRGGALHETMPGYDIVGSASAVVLLALLAPPALGWLRDRGRAARGEGDAPERLTLSIHGMTCSHCSETVQRGLAECPGVASAAVDVRAGRASVAGVALDQAALCRKVAALGYAAEVATE